MKIICLILCFAMMFALTACDSLNEFAQTEIWEKDMFGRFYNTDGQQAQAYFEQIIASIEGKDADALEKLFSANTKTNVANIDSQINMLFEFCSGDMISFYKHGPGSHAERHQDRYYKEIYTTYDFTTTEGDYRLAFLFCSIDSECPENVGLQSVFIIRAEDSDTTRAYWGDDDWTPGITIEYGKIGADSLS